MSCLSRKKKTVEVSRESERTSYTRMFSICAIIEFIPQTRAILIFALEHSSDHGRHVRASLVRNKHVKCEEC